MRARVTMDCRVAPNGPRYGQHLRPIGRAEAGELAEQRRINAVRRQFARKVVGDVVLRLDRRVPVVVRDREAKPGRRARIGAVPERAVEGDQGAARALDGDGLVHRLGQHGVAGTVVRTGHAGEGAVFAGVVGEHPVAVGVQRGTAPGQRHGRLVAVHAERLAIAFTRPLHEAVVGAEARAERVDEVAHERHGHRVHCQVPEGATVGAQLHQLELARLRAGLQFQRAAVVAEVERAGRAVLHAEAAAHEFLRLREQALGERVKVRLRHAGDRRGHHGVTVQVQLVRMALETVRLHQGLPRGVDRGAWH